MLKRFLGVFLACCMLFTLMQPVTFADDTPTFVVSKATGTVDDVVEVTVTMQNNPGIDRAAFKVDFPEGLELTEKPTASDILPPLNFRANLASPYPINMGDNTADETVAPEGVNGVVLTLRFKGSAAGTYDIKLTDIKVRDHDMGTVPFTGVDGSVTLTEGIVEKTYKITYDANGGTPATQEKTVNENDPIPAADTEPTWAEHNFLGWFLDKDGNTPAGNASADVTVYAKWDENPATVKVTYDGNGGEPATQEKTVNPGDPIPTDVTAPTREGYAFAGWFLDKDGNTPAGNASADVTVYAKWDENPATVKVTYDGNGGTPATQEKTVNAGDPIPTDVTEPTRADHEFLGWFLDKDGNTPAGTASADVTVYAKWNGPIVKPVIPVKVTFDGNGGTPATQEKEVNKGDAFPAPATAPTREQYSFDGWFLDKDGQNPAPATVEEDTTVYAVWNPVPVTVKVTFDGNGGEPATQTKEVNKGSALPTPDTTPALNGSDFAGWFLDKDGQTPAPATVDEDTTVYAKWNTHDPDVTYTVTFDGNGGTPSTQTQEVKSGEYATAASTPVHPENKEFKGWSLNKGSTSGDFNFNSTPITGDTTLYAVWGGCYVATSVYGSYDAPEVWTLRRFRDNELGETWYGRLFIKAYYAVSPTVVRLFGECDWFNDYFRVRLDRMVEHLQDEGFESTPYQDLNW